VGRLVKPLGEALAKLVVGLRVPPMEARCCQSVLRIRDVYPGYRILIFTHSGSRISDPKTATKERGEKFFGQTFFCSHKFHKNCKLFYFLNAEEKNLGQLKIQRIIEFFPKNLSLSSKNMGLGSGIPDPGSATLLPMLQKAMKDLGEQSKVVFSAG
jgi:hypothetical protein